MKNKLIVIGLVLSSIFGCQTDYEAPNELSDVGFYNSFGTIKTLNVALNKYASFTDLSQGTIEHSWHIEKDVNFLQGPIKAKDTIYTVINEGDTLTKEKTIILQFNKAGMSKVRLYNVFKDSVTFRGNTGGKNYFMGSKKIAENRWVIDTTFMVKVFDTITPKFEVKQNNIVLDLKIKDTIYVEAGDVLHFSDLTTQGEPTGRTWTIRKALEVGVASSPTDVVASSGSAEADIIFKKLGVFKASLNVTRSAQNVPGASKTVVINRPIKVIPSSKPFVQSGTIKEQANETIQVPFAGEFASFTDAKANFSVKVNGTTFAIASVTLNSTDQTILDLKLTEKIYRPDVITVSYNGTTLKSTDDRILQPFTDKPVVMHDVNLLGDSSISGFENGGALWTKTASSDGTVIVSTDRFATGAASLKLSLSTGQAKAETTVKLPAAVTIDAAKVYTIRYKVFIENGATGVEAPTQTGWTFASNYSPQYFNTVRPPVESGKWLTFEKDYTGTTLITQMWFRIISNSTKTTNVTIYVDDFYMVEKEVRP
ncbi:hypothetical protein ACSV4D_08820 [Flavobacterium sp. ARAG 55.4]|uniref:hypothetical protein n=1 Tax=Flavobacterium sp. ARAG 55.4 TaxID=3451357 RepID=UPI003F461308